MTLRLVWSTYTAFPGLFLFKSHSCLFISAYVLAYVQARA